MKEFERQKGKKWMLNWKEVKGRNNVRERRRTKSIRREEERV